jgi:RNA polymerase sigma factor (sigma-70 family)
MDSREESNMNELIKKYKESLKIVRQLQLRANSEEDIRLLGSMASDLQYSLDWLKTGRKPFSYKGIEAPYDRTRYVDPQIIERTHHECIYPKVTGEIKEPEMERVEYAMCTLSDREKDVYTLHYAELYSFEEIAEMLDVSKGTVQVYIMRARNKIEDQKCNNLFCM